LAIINVDISNIYRYICAENVREYLKLSADAAPQTRTRMKGEFERKNQKLAQNILQLQHKLDEYNRRLVDLRNPATSQATGIYLGGHRPARDMLKNVGQGLK